MKSFQRPDTSGFRLREMSRRLRFVLCCDCENLKGLAVLFFGLEIGRDEPSVLEYLFRGSDGSSGTTLCGLM